MFGGGEDGHVRYDTYVTVESGEIGVQYDPNDGAITDAKWKYRGNVYGSGCGTDVDADGNYNYLAGIVQGETEVNIQGGYISRNVYGGGALASVVGKATVNVSGGTVGDAVHFSEHSMQLRTESSLRLPLTVGPMRRWRSSSTRECSRSHPTLHSRKKGV